MPDLTATMHQIQFWQVCLKPNVGSSQCFHIPDCHTVESEGEGDMEIRL